MSKSQKQPANTEGDVGYAPQENSFIAVYGKLPEKSASTIRFFERNGCNDSYFYTVYDTDAHYAAREHFKTPSAVKYFGSGTNKLDYFNLSRSVFEAFVRELLLVKQFKVEIFTNQARSGHDWAVKYKASPGNLSQFEELLFVNSEITASSGVIGVKISTSSKHKIVGVAHVNTNDFVINLIEFVDNDSLTNFESVLVSLGPPKEAVLAGSKILTDDTVSLIKVLERNRVLINKLPNSSFDTKSIEQDVTKLLKTKSGEFNNFAAHPEAEKKTALAALAGVIKYLELVPCETYLNQFQLETFDFRLYVKMDGAACRALHITADPENELSRKSVTLTSTIDKCRTPQGHRLLAQYLKQPLMDKEKLEERLDLVEILVDDCILRQTLFEDHLRRVPDCQVLARKFMKKKGKLQDYYKGYLCVSQLGRLISLLENYEGSKKTALISVFAEPLRSLEEDFSQFCEMIQSTIDLEMADRGDFVIRPEFDESLKELRTEMDVVENNMSNEAYQVASKLNLEVNKSLKLESNGQHGHYFRITLKEETAIRNEKSFKILDSNKAGVRFRNDQLENLSSKYWKKHRVYEEKQKQFVNELLDVSSGYYQSFEQLGHITAFLDVITSFAVSSVGNADVYVRPKILPRGTGKIRFENLRHPCVETQSGINFIPNDVNFEKGKESFYIVTGPNMGGKSTFLRSIGVATLLAHVGCYVPASYAEVSIVDAILARVGAGDNLAKGVSTFMAEMIETSFILKTATADSLVLIDELGRGTSTYDGFGLCWAISEHLSDKVDCYCVLATHFHELTELSDNRPTVKNLHVVATATENGLEMMYKLQRGSCDRSFGIHVAKVTGFPNDVLEDARNMAMRLEDFCSEKDLDDTMEGVRRRQIDKKSGQEIINEFLKKFTALRDQCSNDIEFKTGLDALIKEVENSENPHVRHILSSIK